MGGRRILDAALIGNDLVDIVLYKKRDKMICKFDMENKAYDSLSWNFMDYMLERLGFGEKWRS